MPDTTAKIRAKGLDATGVTEDLANQMHARRGKHYMAIVEVKVEETHEKSDGTKKVDLILTQVEPATTADLEEHLRELTRTLYYNRGTGDQPTLPAGTDEPTVEGVLAAGAKHRPHPFLPVDASQDNPICDVCGHLETAPVHSTQATLEQDDDEPDTDAEEDERADIEAGQDLVTADEVLDPDEEPWEYETPDGQNVADPFEVPTPN